MRLDQRETAESFLKRKAKNLEFFRRRYPALYSRYSSLLLKRVELVVSPEEADVDLHVAGRSMYNGHAKRAALNEVNSFLEHNKPGRYLKTFDPPHFSGYKHPRFATSALRHCLQKLPDRSHDFSGYPMEDFFPIVVFLGCGLGYHVEALCERADIINAIVFEPDEEKFAASLFSVDWENICSRFLQKRGYDIRFAIGTGGNKNNLRTLLEGSLNKKVPFHPAFTLYFNHQACAASKQLADQVKQDLPKLFAGWGSYDDEVRRLNNTVHNAVKPGRYLHPQNDHVFNKPVVVVGSGPSIDHRIDSLKRHRHEVNLVSAGTGLKALIKQGLKPDYHVELDPDYFIFQLLSEIDKADLQGIKLIAVSEINPLVPGLFEEVYFFSKKDNPLASFVGLHDSFFAHCYPTCTNAALAIFVQMGFRRFFLFGTDYGFRERTKHHAADSVYGAVDEKSDVSTLLNQLAHEAFVEGKVLTVPAVDGKTVLTRPDYYSAKRSVEALIAWAKSAADLKIHNCSDGAIIDGAEWLSEAAFDEQFVRSEPAEDKNGFVVSEHSVERALDQEMDDKLRHLSRSLRQGVRAIHDVLAVARLRGKKDVNKLMTVLADKLVFVDATARPTSLLAVDHMSEHLLRGTLRHFMTIGLCHGMSCGSAEETREVLKVWHEDFLRFLDAVGLHFDRVFLDSSAEESRDWLHKTLHDSETDMVQVTSR